MSSSTRLKPAVWAVPKNTLVRGVDQKRSFDLAPSKIFPTRKNNKYIIFVIWLNVQIFSFGLPESKKVHKLSSPRPKLFVFGLGLDFDVIKIFGTAFYFCGIWFEKNLSGLVAIQIFPNQEDQKPFWVLYSSWADRFFSFIIPESKKVHHKSSPRAFCFRGIWN